DADGGLVQPALQLAEVGIGQAGQVRELPERQVGHLPLGADKGAKRLLLRLPRIAHGGFPRPALSEPLPAPPSATAAALRPPPTCALCRAGGARGRRGAPPTCSPLAAAVAFAA